MIKNINAYSSGLLATLYLTSAIPIKPIMVIIAIDTMVSQINTIRIGMQAQTIQYNAMSVMHLDTKPKLTLRG